MKLTKLMIATIAVCGASQAMAAGVTRLTGASASSVNAVRAFKTLCESNSGAMTLYKTSSSASSLGNQFSAVCSADIAGSEDLDADGNPIDGTAKNQLRMNVAGGSETAILNATLNPYSTPANAGFLVPTSSCANTAAVTSGAATVAAGGGLGTLAFMAAGTMKNCGTTLSESTTSHGGYLDVEGNWFNPVYQSSDFQAAGFSQVFGVAVNAALYSALQTAQGLTGTCAGSAVAACQPSIGKANLASLMNNNISGSGPKSLGGSIFGAAVPANNVSYCMRPQTSGTQQSAQLFFLNYSDANGKMFVVGNNFSSGTLPKYKSYTNSGSGNVRACLNGTTGGSGDTAPAPAAGEYRFGVLSAENNPIGSSSDTYRFVKVDGAAAVQGASATDSNTATALTGDYNFVYETVAFCPGGTCDPLVSLMSTALPAGASTPGLFLTGVESKYGRAGNSALPYSRR